MIPLNAGPENRRGPITHSAGKWAAGLLRLLPLLLLSPGAAAEPPHPLLAAVCRNDYAAVSGLSPQHLELDAITWGWRNLRALDLAVANGHWEIAALLMHSGAVVSSNTLSTACDLKHAKALCVRHPQWQHHQTCRAAEDPSRWAKNCRPPERSCRKILKQLPQLTYPKE